jgi:hypothetical protein
MHPNKTLGTLRINNKMKYIVYFGVFVTLLLSCSKEPSHTIPSGTGEASPLLVRFSDPSHTINTRTILNPQPTNVRAYTSGKRIEYDFYIDGSIYPWLRVEISDYYINKHRGTDTVYSVRINIEEALTKNQKDGFITTFKNSGLVTFPEFDSTFQLSYDSPIISPFSDTLHSEVFEGPDTRFFSPEDSIDLKDATLQWSAEADNNNILSHFVDHGFYPHRNHLFQLRSENDSNLYSLHHDYHHGTMGDGKKIFVFRWLNSSQRDYYYHGWMEFSLTQNREFTIHKVVFQID